MVGASGFEPLTPSASRKCSPPELRTYAKQIYRTNFPVSEPEETRQGGDSVLQFALFRIIDTVEIYCTPSFRALPAANFTTFLAAIWIEAPV